MVRKPPVGAIFSTRGGGFVIGGVLYIILFGVGTIASMSVITIIISVPFAMSGNNMKLNNTVNSIAGLASILFGLALGSDLALGTSIIPF